jgi:hypothetical protein
MLDAFFIKIVFNLSVLELGAIITSYSLDFSIKLILCSLQKISLAPLEFHFYLAKRTPK